MSSDIVVPHSLRVREILPVTVGVGLSTIAVVVRVYTKARLAKSVKSEDYFSVLALLSFLAYASLGLVISESRGSLARTAYLSSIGSAVYCPVIVAVKISILLQYVTLFVVYRRTMLHYIIHGLIWINVVYYFIAVMLGLLLCSPKAKVQDPSNPPQCFSRGRIWVLTGALNVLSDFSILGLPIPIIYRLRIPWKKKSRVFAVFAVGLLACATSILRLAYSAEMLGVKGRNPVSRQLLINKIGLWGFIEISLGIIAGCMPVFPRFFKQFSLTFSLTRIRLFSTPTAERTSWRCLLLKYTSNSNSNNDDDITPPTFHNLTNSKESVPDIVTLNSKSSSTPLTEQDLPRAPSPIHKQDKYREAGSSSSTGLGSGTFWDVEEGGSNEQK